MDEVFNRVARRRRRGQGGFTLIELLVVIAVLAVLAAIVIFNVVGRSEERRVGKECTDSKWAQTAVEDALNDGVVFTAGAMNAGEWISLVPAYRHTPQ